MIHSLAVAMYISMHRAIVYVSIDRFEMRNMTTSFKLTAKDATQLVIFYSESHFQFNIDEIVTNIRVSTSDKFLSPKH